MRFEGDVERVMALPAPSGPPRATAEAEVEPSFDAPAEPIALRAETIQKINEIQRLDEIQKLDEIEEETKRLIWLTEHVSENPLAEADLNASERLRHAEATAAALLAEARRKADALVTEAHLSAAQRRAETEEWRRAHIADADKVATQRLLDAEYRARDVIEEARVEASKLRVESESRVDEPAQSVEQNDPEPPAARREPRGIAGLAKVAGLVVLLVVTAAVVATLIRSTVAAQYTVASASMEPGLHEGDHIVVNKVAYELDDARRGDIVVLDVSRIPNASPDLGETVVKRVVGLPGEVVQAGGGRLLINGDQYDEPWLGDVQTQPFGPVEVSDGSLFVLGDERAESIDSRTFGTVPIDAVVGRVEAIVWPPDRVGRV